MPISGRNARHNAGVDPHDAVGRDPHHLRIGDSDVRRDPFTGDSVHIVGHRQTRPSMTSDAPSSGCPFCPGGLEAPEPYDTRFFPNRWPAMPDERCEVVLYTPNHDASITDLGISGVRRVIDVWAQRTQALAQRPDVDYVLVFENRGSEVGATIAHPHCQIYAYDHIPARPATMFANGWCPDPTTERTITDNGSWTTFVPHAPAFPVAVTLAPTSRVGHLFELDETMRNSLAAALIDAFTRLDHLFDTALPTMMWINQQPCNGEFADAWMSIEIVSPWRAKGLPRFIAAAEIGGGEYFLPVVPEEIAASLRARR